MQVKHLIRDTIWIPGSAYDSKKTPRVSVLLPTFRRGKSGLFRRCVESVLSQSIEDIELIIVDDASTDGTSRQIAEFQAKDRRVSCLRHPKNIGLPAISEYEAYLRARAEHIAFAFDDTRFNEDALEALLDEAEETPWAAICGHVELSAKDPISGEFVTVRLGSAKPQGLLRTSNFIPNNGMLLPRRIIEDVGLYDPHIVIARLCDWDMWCRVAERYEIRFVDVAVGTEEGPMTGDSLGNTYGLDWWAVDEWMRTPRNKQLHPSNFAEYEVLAPRPAQSVSTQTVIETLARKHARARGWTLPEPATSPDDVGHILVVNTHHNASTYLYFDMLPADVAKRVRVISANSGYGVEELARATCVIFVREINAFKSWIEAAKLAEIPMYYFLDDNLPLLVKHEEMSFGQEDYRLTRFREQLNDFDGALLSSDNLKSYFEENLLHWNLTCFPVAFSNQQPLSKDHIEPKIEGEIVIAFAGGPHRSKGLWEIIVPALKRLAIEGALIHLITPFSDELEDEDLNFPDNMRVTTFTFDPSYLFVMRRFSRYSPDFVVHAPSDTCNNPYKTLHPLIAACLMNAVLVLPDSPPYDQIVDVGNAVIVHDAFKPVSWHKTFKKLIDGDFPCSDIKSQNNAYCAQHFSGETNVQVLRQILARHGGEPSWAMQATRLHKLAGWLRSSPSVLSPDKDLGAIDTQLAEYRKMVRYSWRHRILPGNGDLWDAVSPAFNRLKTYSARQGWRRHNSSLELSDSLHDIPFREYKVRLPAGKLRAINVAISVDHVQHGQVGMEVVGPDGLIKEHTAMNLGRLNLSEPVRFNLPDLRIDTSGEEWKIRVFARTQTPAYIFEFVNRRLLGLRFTLPTPFMEMIID